MKEPHFRTKGSRRASFITAIMADDDDPVVEEIDVYLTKSVAENLYLFQYPVRPSSMIHENMDNVQAKVKPKQHKVELEIPLNVGSNYDKEKGAQIARNVDGGFPGEDSFFQSSLMDKQILTSSKVASNCAHYAVGLLRGGRELHLTPLSAVIQLRPNFMYLDQSDNRAKAEGKGCDGDDQSQEEEEEAKAISVRFAGPDNERSRQARERSYNYVQKQLANEPWVNVAYHGYGSRESEEESNILLCSQTGNKTSPLLTTPDSYVKSLLSETLKQTPTAVTTNKPKAICDIRNYPLLDQIKLLIVNAKVVQFHKLLQCLPTNTDAVSVLRSLQQVAMLVRGCWVVKSDILYPKDSISPLTGTNSELLCRARDYIMWRYTQNNILQRNEIVSIVKLPEVDVADILKQMGHWKPSKGWEFLHQFDHSFIAKYPEVVQRQQMLWDARYQQLTKIFRLGQAKATLPSAKTSPVKPRKQRKSKSHQDSISDDTEGSGAEGALGERMEIETSPKLKRNALIHKNRPFNDLSASCVEINDNCVQTNGPASHFLHPVSSADLLTEIKPELLKLLQERLFDTHCVTLNDIKLFLGNVPPECISNSELSDKCLEEYIIAAGAEKLQNKWPPNTTAEPLYAITDCGDHLDKCRKLILSIFSKKPKVRLATVRKRIEEDIGEELSNAEYKQLMQEYCVSKSGFYYLKGTLQVDS